MSASMRRKREYITPAIEMLEARVEKGFAVSRFENVPDPNSTGLGDRYTYGGNRSNLFT